MECLVAKLSRILYFAGYSMRENIYHAVIYHRVSMVTWAYLTCEENDMAATYLCNQRQRLSRGLSNSLENLLTAAAFPFSLAYLPICARCLSVSRPYDPRARVFALASRFSTDKTSRFAFRIAGGGISAESGPAGSGRWPLTGLKQRSSAIVQ